MDMALGSGGLGLGIGMGLDAEIEVASDLVFIQTWALNKSNRNLLIQARVYLTEALGPPFLICLS